MGQYFPFNYEQINIAAGSYNPSPVKAYNNRTFAFWERALFQRACSVLKLEVPEEWEGKTKDFLLYCLYKFGFVAISKNAEYGQFFQPCALYGYNFYYQPTEAIISNPQYNARLKIGEECELLKLSPDFIGIWDIISVYAEKLSELDNAINMSIINEKFAFFIGARNKVAGEALKKMLDKVNRGEPSVVFDMKLLNDATDKEMPFQIWDRGNLKESYITTDQLRDMQTILNGFDTEVGIPTIPYEKKERMVTSEADSKIIDAMSRSTVWYECLTSSIMEVKKLYPDINLSVSLRYDYMQDGGDRDE